MDINSGDQEERESKIGIEHLLRASSLSAPVGGSEALEDLE
jgi:hypothetical protein